ncbi:unnamed protein product [Boreogadus saida]
MYDTGTRHDYDRTVACTASMGPTTALPEESMGGPQLWDCHKEGGWLDRMTIHFPSHLVGSPAARSKEPRHPTTLPAETMKCRSNNRSPEQCLLRSSDYGGRFSHSDPDGA